ncbi:MAG: DUF2344 domain-containing protein [Christensenellaceae bacterium]|nr:DUF2344 domain-containing protein [Christensenellaceae bacterium]
MRIGVKFAREGMSKFISHLDVQSMFSRALRRTGLCTRYSNGFNPHMVTSFASAMAVGMETQGDYMEFFVEEEVSTEKIAELLQQALPEGFSVVRVGVLPETGKKLMALLEQASYEIFCPAEEWEKWQQAFLAIMAMESCIAARTKKGKTKEMDIRPLIYEGSAEDGCIRVRLALSGAQSLGPALLMEKAAQLAQLPGFGGRIVRKELYTLVDGKLTALEELFA